MRSFSNLFSNFKATVTNVPALSETARPSKPIAQQSQQSYTPNNTNTPSLSHKHNRSRFDALINRSGDSYNSSNSSGQISSSSLASSNSSRLSVSSVSSVSSGQQKRILSPNANPCADINHPKWIKLNSTLAPFATARMEKLQAQDAHFSKEVRQQQGGICYGASAVWFGLHECTPIGGSTQRMNALMSGPGIQTAWTAQKFYNHISDEFEAKPKSEIAELSKHGAAHYDTAVINQSSMFGLAATTKHTHIFSGSSDFSELGKIMAKVPGKFTLPMNLSLPSGGEGRHAMNVVSHSDKTLTVFDSNIGEFHVSVKDFPQFMRGIQQFYESTRGMNFHSVGGIQSMHRIDPNGEPALLGLSRMTPED